MQVSSTPAVLEIGLFGGAQRAVRTNLTERWRQYEADGKRKREEEKRDRKREKKKREREWEQSLKTEDMVCSVL